MNQLLAKALNVFGVVFVATFVLSACTTMKPETPNEKLAAAEISYEAALHAVRDLNLQGAVPDNVKPRVVELIQGTRGALDFWHLVPDDISRQQAAIVALSRLNLFITDYLQRLENDNGSNGSSTDGSVNRFRPASLRGIGQDRQFVEASRRRGQRHYGPRVSAASG